VFGMMTPPVGAVLFTVCGVAKTRIEPVIWESLPLLAWILVVIVLVAFVPSLSLALPHFLGYGR
jgi:TRAP-type C4-dicarboxylate transport system permease large subunit